MIPIAIVAALELWLASQLPIWVAWFVGWAGLATGWVAFAYAVGRPRLLGKLDAPTLAGVLLAPYLMTSRMVARAAQRGGLPERQEIVPGLWVGGWPTRGPSPLAHVDVTAELPRRVTSPEWRCVPMLDGAPFAAGAWAEAVVTALRWRQAGRGVLVHCAYGHGRSVAVVVGVLLAEGTDTTIDDALARVRKVRPRARLILGQRAALEVAIRMFSVAMLREAASGALPTHSLTPRSPPDSP